MSEDEEVRARTGTTRREVLKSAGVVLALGLVSRARFGQVAGHVDRATSGGRLFLRPPGAVDESEFASRCVRCHKCGEGCSNSCIRYVDSEGAVETRGTPYIVPREKGCMLCMKCNNVCPSGALKKVPAKHPRLWELVNMGKARIDKNICHSENGYICGVCIRACPLRGKALSAGMWEKPVLNADHCVGCGLCEQACLHMPQAIRVQPRRRS